MAGPVVEAAREVVSDLASERVAYWRGEVARPWSSGRPGGWAEVGRWIGTGLAVGAVVCGVIAAVRAERRRDLSYPAT